MPATLRRAALDILAREEMSTLDALAFFFLIILIILSPIPYGGVTADEELRIVLLAFSTGSIALMSNWRRPVAAAFVAIASLLLVAIAGIIQVLPLPSAILQQLSPESLHIWGQADAILRSAGDSRPLTLRISIAPQATVRTLLLVLSYCSAFTGSLLILRTRFLRRMALVTLMGVSLIHVAWAALTQSGDARLHGTFINPNNFAGYLEIGLAVAFGLALTEILTGRESIGRTQSRGAMVERRLIRLIPWTLGWSVIAIGIGMTRSRMGIAAAILTALLLAAAAMLHRSAATRRAQLSMAGGGVLVTAILVTALATRETPFLRFLASDPRDPESDVRFRLWSLSLEAWRRFPIFGSGLGTFRDSFRRVQPADFPGLFEHAHSDYVQLLVTAGAIGMVVAVAGFSALLLGLGRSWWNQKHREESTVILAAIGAVVSLLIHGAAEFNLSIPAIPMTLAIVAGAACAAAGSHSSRASRPAARPPVSAQ